MDRPALLPAGCKSLWEADSCCGWNMHLVPPTFRAVCTQGWTGIHHWAHTALNISITRCTVQPQQLSASHRLLQGVPAVGLDAAPVPSTCTWTLEPHAQGIKTQYRYLLCLTEITVLSLAMSSSAFLSRKTEPSFFRHHPRSASTAGTEMLALRWDNYVNVGACAGLGCVHTSDQMLLLQPLILWLATMSQPDNWRRKD